MVRRDATGGRAAALRARWLSRSRPGTGALRPLPVMGPVMVVLCWALGLASFGVALEIAVRRSPTAVGPVSDVYLTLVVGALLVLLGILVWLRHQHQSHRAPQTTAGPDTPLNAPDFHSLSLAAPDPATAPREPPAPTHDVEPAAAGLLPTGQTRSSDQMLVAYKRAAEKHSADAALQRTRAEAAEARVRELEERVGTDDGPVEAPPERESPTVGTPRRFVRFTDAYERVIRGHRRPGGPTRQTHAPAPPSGEAPERTRRLLALAATCERQRIEDLLLRLRAEYDRTLPPDRARLAREQADHLRHAIEELAIADTVRLAEQQADTVSRDAAGRTSRA